MTDKQFRGWVREWFQDQVRERAGDSDRAFAKLVGLTATEVNHITNNKRFPSWKMIAKVTDKLGVAADDFLLDIVRRARAEADAIALGKTSPITFHNGKGASTIAIRSPSGARAVVSRELFEKLSGSKEADRPGSSQPQQPSAEIPGRPSRNNR